MNGNVDTATNLGFAQSSKPRSEFRNITFKIEPLGLVDTVSSIEELRLRSLRDQRDNFRCDIKKSKFFAVGNVTRLPTGIVLFFKIPNTLKFIKLFSILKKKARNQIPKRATNLSLKSRQGCHAEIKLAET